jgi:hypothetical protein
VPEPNHQASWVSRVPISAGRQTADGRRIYRMVGPQVIWWAWTAVVVLSLGDLAIQGHDLSALRFALGLLMMVNTEGKVGGTDLQNNMAYHAAEGGMEKMTSDLAATFQNAESPTASQICAVSNQQPSMVGVTWQDYSVQPASGCSGPLKANFGQISSGQDQGLWAQIIPINMLTTAALPGGQEVSMTRGAQIALIPVFQYGVFCEGDCAFFNNPTLDFAGPVHANGDLYLGVAAGNTITFHEKLAAYGNVVTNNLPNTLAASSTGDTGTVYIPTTDGGCPVPGKNGSSYNCASFPASDGSVTGMGGSPPGSLYNKSFDIGSYASSYNTAFNTFSTSVNHELINGDYGNTNSSQVGTGAKQLKLPFVTGTTHNYELIRRATGADSSLLSQSREYNMAQIRVLLSDDPVGFRKSEPLLRLLVRQVPQVSGKRHVVCIRAERRQVGHIRIPARCA